MLAVYVAILSLICHFTSGQVDEKVEDPVVPVKPDGSFYNTVSNLLISFNKLISKSTVWIEQYNSVTL